MKKLFLALFLLLGTFIILSYVDVEDVSAGEVTGFDFTYNINLGGNITPSATLNREYGDIVSIDAGTLAHDGHEYVGFLENGKVLPVINGSKSFRITETTNIEVFYKPTGSTVVIFMDANQDYLEVRYTDATNNPGTGNLPYNETDNLLPDHTAYTKPGLTASGWTADGLTTIDFSTHEFTEDTIVFPLYQSSVSGDLTLSVENGTVNEASPYSFNQTVTVSANGSGTFNYWLKDGIIASLDETYSFTMADNHDLVAVYDSGFVADFDIFISANGYMVDGSPVILGQFDIPEDEDLVEWGILTSDMDGGITLNTPNVTIVNSNKYNPNTNEFVLSFDTALDNFRAFIKTVNQTSGEVSTVYSYYQESNIADDLIISEVLDWDGGTNKAIELYNGTDATIDLSNYSIKTSSNGNTGWTNTSPNPLIGSILSGETFVLTNADLATITAKSDYETTANFNGNDAIGLFKNDALIDIFGVLGEDPGTGWSIDGNNTADATIVRNPSVISPYVGTGNTWDVNQWSHNDDTVEYLGIHTMNTSSILVTNNDKVTSFELLGTETFETGNTSQLSVLYTGTGLEGVVWVSSNTGVATVDENGLVTGAAAGTATITAYSYYDYDMTAIVTITVEEASASITELFISEYGEGGSGNNKWIEIYNGTGADVNLTGYSLKLNSNDNTTWGNELLLSGTLLDGDVLVVFNSGSDYANVVAEGDVSGSVTYFNGDDAIGLFKNDTLIDIFGVFGEDPGSGWDVGSTTNATANHTLVRKSSVTGPTTTWVPSEWEVYPDATDTYVGSHTSNPQ